MQNSVTAWTIAAASQLAALAIAAPAHAQAFQNLDRLDSLVVTTVGANIGEPGGPIAPVDRRLRLAACPQVPSIEGPVFGAAIVRCDKLGWRIRVPLALEKPVAAASAYGRAQAPVPQPRMILVKKGDPVQLVAGNAAFSVSKAMIADEDGAVGDMIRVREDRNSPAVSGRVDPNGIVRVPGI